MGQTTKLPNNLVLIYVFAVVLSWESFEFYSVNQEVQNNKAEFPFYNIYIYIYILLISNEHGQDFEEWKATCQTF